VRSQLRKFAASGSAFVLFRRVKGKRSCGGDFPNRSVPGASSVFAALRMHLSAAPRPRGNRCDSSDLQVRTEAGPPNDRNVRFPASHRPAERPPDLRRHADPQSSSLKIPDTVRLFLSTCRTTRMASPYDSARPWRAPIRAGANRSSPSQGPPWELLDPVARDFFKGLTDFTFMRDDRKHVTGFSLSSSGVRGLRFERLKR
jgi:hypothetical protein